MPLWREEGHTPYQATMAEIGLRALILAALVDLVSTHGQMAPFAKPRTCKGEEREWGACPGLPKCISHCEPVNCKFSEWGDWAHAAGCTGLCERHRSVDHENNECGVPCTGPRVSTKRCASKNCAHLVHDFIKKDCALDTWGAWTTCTESTDQRIRVRTILQEPANGGKECIGILKETKPCGSTPPVDCKLSEWGAWTACSATCGGGHQTQMRRVAHAAVLGGKPCTGTLRRFEECSTEPCAAGKSCIMGSWNDWAGCDKLSPMQKFRTREVEQPAEDGGAPCDDVVKETMGCIKETKTPVPCKISQWSDWAMCDTSCDGGQTSRQRRLEMPPLHGGTCETENLKETKPCSTMPCTVTGITHCQLSQWSHWTGCSNKCGSGVSERSRKVLVPAGAGGGGCNGALKESKGCSSDTCKKQDCVWSEWDEWSGCTCTCGGGTKRTSRVVKTAPANGGKLCDLGLKSMVLPCNTQPCKTCVDGSWAEWSAWSQCSATCGDGYRSRHRDIGVPPNDCGVAPTGLEDEYEKCSTGLCDSDIDCKLSAWTEWTDCSCSCFGVKERHRQIAQFASGNGKTCSDESLKEVSQCNPAKGEAVKPTCGLPPPRGCVMGDWVDWGDCSAECDGGQRTRTRTILTPSSEDGVPCKDSLAEVEGCHSQPCDKEVCIDCKWKEWSEWGSCTKCGNQKYRQRSVMQLPTSCGKLCDARDAKQATTCISPCEKVAFCAWSDWSAFSPCSSECGSSTKVRQRLLGTYSDEPANWLFKGDGSMTCDAKQMEAIACQLKKCEEEAPVVDCKFGEWADWSAPTCLQLCERSRVIELANANGGKPCDGPLMETKRCKSKCNDDTPTDCDLTSWSEWTACKPDVQRFRHRSILTMGSNGGKACDGKLKETEPCGSHPVAKQSSPCVLDEWGKWSACTKTCGGGVMLRNRVIKSEAAHGGEPCSGDLEELRVCATDSCKAETTQCAVGEWTQWTPCSASQQKYRERKIVKEGNSCGMPLKEVKPCLVVVDCEVSEWTAWDSCDRTCDGGQQQRQRQILKLPKNAGKACPENLAETQACNDVKCASGTKQDCAVDEWTQWSECTAKCGSGSQERTRNIMVQAEGEGAACDHGLSQVRSCQDEHGNGLPPCSSNDCRWHDWSEWSSCSCSCNGGQRERDRGIKQLPSKGGKTCEPLDKEEVEPCNTQPCKSAACVDGRWDDWEDWEVCSKTCSGGLTWRTRKVLTEANACGHPALGASRVYASCNNGVSCTPDVDCVFSDWDEWSACTKDCDGVKRRARRIRVQGRGEGAFCVGDLQQTAPCHPSKGEDVPPKCQKGPPVDCKFSDWMTWGSCSATCAGGQKERSRKVMQEAENNGSPCQGPLHQISGCATAPCDSACVPQNCKWGEWSPWAACDKCGGQRQRFRHVVAPPNSCGKPCEAAASEEVADCPRKCHEPTYCMFGDWMPWGGCSTSCGNGLRSRTRNLKLATISEMRMLEGTEEELPMAQKFEALQEETQALESHHVQDMVIAFACGLLSLVAGLAVVRSRSRLRSEERSMGLSSVSVRNAVE